jgi:hypothetical protein
MLPMAWMQMTLAIKEINRIKTHVHANSKVAIGWQTFVTPRFVNAKLPPQKLIERPT